MEWKGMSSFTERMGKHRHRSFIEPFCVSYPTMLTLRPRQQIHAQLGEPMTLSGALMEAKALVFEHGTFREQMLSIKATLAFNSMVLTLVSTIVNASSMLVLKPIWSSTTGFRNTQGCSPLVMRTNVLSTKGLMQSTGLLVCVHLMEAYWGQFKRAGSWVVQVVKFHGSERSNSWLVVRGQDWLTFLVRH